MHDDKPRVSAHDLRFVPQCGTVAIAAYAIDVAVEALTAAHPELRRRDYRYCAPQHLESIADLAILQAKALVETLVRYQLLALNPRADFGEDPNLNF